MCFYSKQRMPDPPPPPPPPPAKMAGIVQSPTATGSRGVRKRKGSSQLTVSRARGLSSGLAARGSGINLPY